MLLPPLESVPEDEVDEDEPRVDEVDDPVEPCAGAPLPTRLPPELPISAPSSKLRAVTTPSNGAPHALELLQRGEPPHVRSSPAPSPSSRWSSARCS